MAASCTVVSAPGFSTTFSGDTAASFGAAERDVRGIDGFDFAGTGKPFSLECWVNGPSGQPDGSAILAKGNGPSGVPTVFWQFVLQTSGGNFDFLIQNSSGVGADVQAPGLGPDGTWHHIVATYDGTMTLYFGGLTFQITAEGRGHSTGNLTVYILKMRDEVAKMIKEG